MQRGRDLSENMQILAFCQARDHLTKVLGPLPHQAHSFQ